MEQTRTVLIVDDEPDALEAARSYLSDQGFQVATASRWTEAVAQIQEGVPDLVLLDLYLPTVQGEALLEFVREFNADLPVVIVSADIDAQKMEHLGELGAKGFVRKPFEANDLLLVVEQVLAQTAPAAQGNGRKVLGGPQSPARESATPPPPPPLPPPPTPLSVSPGAGVEALGRQRQVSVTPPPTGTRRRRVTRGRSRLKRIRNYALALVLFALIAFTLWLVRESLSAGFFGIGIRTTATEDEPK